MPKAAIIAPPARGFSRRAALVALGVVPVAVAGALSARGPAVAAPPPADGIVLHEGWVLRADDLERLGRA